MTTNNKKILDLICLLNSRIVGQKEQIKEMKSAVDNFNKMIDFMEKENDETHSVVQTLVTCWSVSNLEEGTFQIADLQIKSTSNTEEHDGPETSTSTMQRPPNVSERKLRPQKRIRDDFQHNSSNNLENLFGDELNCNPDPDVHLSKRNRQQGKIQEEISEDDNDRHTRKLPPKLIPKPIMPSTSNAKSSGNREGSNAKTAGNSFEETTLPSQKNSLGHGLHKKRKIGNGNVKYVCYCGLTFNSFETLKRHYLKKTQGLVHTCPFGNCKKQFLESHDLVNHTKKRHNCPVYSCNLCFTQFSIRKERDQHLKMDSRCGEIIKAQRQSRQPMHTPLREGTYSMPSIRVPNDTDDDDF